MEIPLLRDIVIIFGLAIIVIWGCNKIRIPPIVGLLLTGIICGPHGFAVIRGLTEVDTLAKIGIILLLFTIGLEFSLKRLMQIKKFFLVGGLLQVGLTTLVGVLVAKFLHRPWGEAIFLGWLLSMSSTAIVLKSFDEQDSTDSPSGRLSLGILIFQDLIAIPMILVIPLLSDNSTGEVDKQFIIHFLIGIGVVILAFIAAIKIVPQILDQVAKVRSRELFSLTVIGICLAVALLASVSGLSLSLGAFLAGLIISESEYRYEAVGHVLPIQDIFSSLFFVSIGMVLDVHFVFEQPFLILSLTAAIMLMKGAVVFLTTLALELPLAAMLYSGVALSQIGEFSFVLGRSGFEHGLGTEYYHQLFLAIALLSMALAPALIRFCPHLLQLIPKLPIPEKWKSGWDALSTKQTNLKDHIVIIGFGLAGQHLAKASKNAQLPYVILEMNADTVKKEALKGEPIHFGDASHEKLLKHLEIPYARAVAIMINDPHAIRRIVPLVRKMNKDAYVIVRTRYLQEVPLLHYLGANDVIPDELGSSIEMFARVLQHYHIPSEEIDQAVLNLRQETLGSLKVL